MPGLAVEAAKLLMAADEQGKITAAVSTQGTEFDELRTQLTEQVATLITKKEAQRRYTTLLLLQTSRTHSALLSSEKSQPKMLYLWLTWTFGKGMLAGKQPWDACMRQQTSPSLLSTMNTVVVPCSYC